MKKTILKKGKRYTFHDYFELNNPTDEILSELGYQFANNVIDLPTSDQFDKAGVENLSKSLYTILPQIVINSEMAKREFLIAPIIMELVKNTSVKVNVEYPIDVNDKLCGLFDYLIRSEKGFIVVEAKKGDLDKGFTQLAAEMIALDQYEDKGIGNQIYGAITIGNLWQFGLLDRQKKMITKDINSFPVPGELEKLFSVLIGILAT